MRFPSLSLGLLSLPLQPPSLVTGSYSFRAVWGMMAAAAAAAKISRSGRGGGRGNGGMS